MSNNDWMDFDEQEDSSAQTPDSPLYDDGEADAEEEAESGEQAEQEPEAHEHAVDATNLQFGADPARATGSSDEFIKAGEYRFSPAMGSIAGRVSADTSEKTAVKADGYTLTWWEDQSIMPKYPYMLLNPFAHSALQGEYESYADAFRLEKGEQFVICDSGGYQLITQADKSVECAECESEVDNLSEHTVEEHAMSVDEYREKHGSDDLVDTFKAYQKLLTDDPEEHSFSKKMMHPETIVEWQVRNADIGPILDVPPNVITGSKIPSNKALEYNFWYDEVFKPRLEETANIARRQAEHLERLRDANVPGADDFKQLLVIHGRPAKQEGWNQWAHLDEWHHTIEEEMGQPDAYALKPQPSNSLGQMAFQLAYAAVELQDKTDYIHVLQCGGQTQRILLDYFSMLTDLFITSDASSHIMGTVWREFSVPGSWSSETLSLSDRDENHVDRIPCRCIVCQRAAKKWSPEDVTIDNGAQDGQYINMHNLHQTLTLSYTISGLMRKYGPDVVDQVEVKKDKVKPDDGNQFWSMLRKKLSHGQISNLHTAMRVVRDSVEGGESALEKWRFEWSSQGQDNEPTMQRESNALDQDFGA